MYIVGESEAPRETTKGSGEREPEPSQILPLPEKKPGAGPPGEWQAGTFGFYLSSASDLPVWCCPCPLFHLSKHPCGAPSFGS